MEAISETVVKKPYIFRFLRSLYDWVLKWADSPYPVLALFLLSFSESSFFPVPPDLLLIVLCVANPKKALRFVLVCTIGSVLGGMFGYLIGFYGGKPVLLHFITEEKVEMVHNYFQKYEGWAIGIAGFTPIPYKVFTIAAGIFYVDFKIFVLASILSRGARFFIQGILIKIFGARIKEIIEKYFNLLSILFVILLIGGFLVLKLVK